MPAQLFKTLELEEVAQHDLTQKAASVKNTVGQKGKNNNLQINGQSAQGSNFVLTEKRKLTSQEHAINKSCKVISLLQLNILQVYLW